MQPNWVRARVFCRAEDIDAFHSVIGLTPETRQPFGAFYLFQPVPQVPQGEAIIGKPFLYEHTGGDRYPSGETVFDGFESSTFETGSLRSTYVISWANRDDDLEKLARHRRLRERTLEKLNLAGMP